MSHRFSECRAFIPNSRMAFDRHYADRAQVPSQHRLRRRHEPKIDALAGVAAVSVISQSTSWASANLWLIALTVMIANARYVLYGAAMRPWLASVSPLKSYGSLFILGDGNWVLSMKAHADGERDVGFVLGSGLAMFTPWLAGTLVGASIGSLVPNPKALGLDFLLVAFSAAAAVAIAKSRNDVWTVAAAAAIALAVQQIVPGGWPIVAAGIVGAIVGYLRWKPAGSTVQ